MKKGIKILLSMFLTFSLFACSKDTENVKDYEAGTYKGISENGRGGNLEVEVTFSSAEIENVVVTAHQETPGLSDAAIEKIPAEIVEYQSLAVDVVSGSTITSNAIIEAVADAVKQAGGDADALLSKTIEKELSQEVIELEATVIVVGAGAAGYSAALTAFDEGAQSVIVVEKAGTIGGNAIVSGGFIENLDEELRPENNEGYRKVIEDIIAQGPQNASEEAMWDEFVADYNAFTASGSTKIYDSNIYHALDLARNEGVEYTGTDFPDAVMDFNHWFEEKTGAEWKKPTAGIVGYSWPRWASLEGYYSGQGYFHYFDQWIEKDNANITFLTNTPMSDLIIDDNGRVSGVVAVNKDGTTYRITGEKGVILCTGGYGANTEMVKATDEIWGDLITDDIITTNAAGITGEGILIAEKAGAMLMEMDNTMLFPMANIHTGSTESIVGTTASSLMVNQEGLRFCDETKDRYTISGAMLAQTNKMGYIISSSENALITNGKTQGGEDVEHLIKNGELYRAETIEELSAITGINADNLKATIEQYNNSCITYVDEEFGRTTFEPNSQILTAPYYAYPCTPATHITMGGVVVDDFGHVIDKNGMIMEGLYAAGDITAYNCGIDGAFAYGRAVAKTVMSE